MQKIRAHLRWERADFLLRLTRGVDALTGGLLEDFAHEKLPTGGCYLVVDLHDSKSYGVSFPPAAVRNYDRLDDLDIQPAMPAATVAATAMAPGDVVEEIDEASSFYFQPTSRTEGAVDGILPPRVCVHVTKSSRHPISRENIEAVMRLFVSLWEGLKSLIHAWSFG
jgi:hypothetical protein